MSASPSGSSSSHPQPEAQDDANFDPTNIQNNRLPSPIPFINEANKTTTQSNGMSIPTQRLGQPPSPPPIPPPTITHRRENRQTANTTPLLSPSHPDSAPGPSLTLKTQQAQPAQNIQTANSNAMTASQPTDKEEHQFPSPEPQLQDPPNPHQPTETHSPGFDPAHPFPSHDWTDLEVRFQAKMDECARAEEGIEAEFRGLLSMFRIWTQTGSVCEEERSLKRLRTRIAYVQNSEKTLEEKRMHHIKVTQAFESALALLSSSSSSDS